MNFILSTTKLKGILLFMKKKGFLFEYFVQEIRYGNGFPGMIFYKRKVVLRESYLVHF